MIRNDDRSGQAGFTLIEVIISIAVLTVGVLAVAKLQAVAVRGNTQANQMMEDTISGQDIIERIIAANYGHDSLNDIDNDGDAGMDDRGAAADYSLDSTDGNYYNAGGAWNIDTENEIFSIFWNVKVNAPPDDNTKTIQFIIVSDTPQGEKVQEYEFIKGQLNRP